VGRPAAAEARRTKFVIEEPRRYCAESMGVTPNLHARLACSSRVATIVSIIESCRRLGIPVRNYLGSVLPGLADFRINRIGELKPGAWAARSS
jgi:hypothetical protein